MACNSPRTVASITVSPTTIFAPPIRELSMLTEVSTFLPKRRSRPLRRAPSWASSSGKALIICARATPSAWSFSAWNKVRISGSKPMRSASISTRMKLRPFESS